MRTLILNFLNEIPNSFLFENKQNKIIELNTILEEKNTDLRKALIDTISSVAKALEIRDPYTAGHQLRVSQISVEIGKRLNFDEDRLEVLRLGASIHDIGKLAIPVELLCKPTRLNEIEYALVKTHTKMGNEIFKDVNFAWCIKEIILQHHEHIDGSGYPLGLLGDEIILEAKIVTVADVFEAISSHRPYRPALGVSYAIEELKHNRGKFYDSLVVDTLFDLVNEKIIIY